MKEQNPDSLICIRVFETSFAANLALTMLHDEGIPAQIDGSVWPSVVGVGTFGAGGYRLMVFARDVPRVKELIKDING